MSWSIGFDPKWNRDIGYGVPAYCDSPDCWAEIDRGLAHVCCGEEPCGGEHGCGLYFCSHHLFWSAFGMRCRRCNRNREPYDAKPDHRDWISHKLSDASWKKWRRENPVDVEKLRAAE